MRKAYRSDVTDAQWELIAPLLPPAKFGGRPREVELREAVNTILYQARTGCQWDMLPHDLMPKSTAFDYFQAWGKDGTWQKVVDALRGVVRTDAKRHDTPSAACIDTQSVKTTEVGGDHGYDGGKKVNGRKRHIVVDTLGLLLVVAVSAADLDDGAGAPLALGQLDAKKYPRLEVVYADQKYKNRSLDQWREFNRIPFRVEVVVKKDGEKGFRPLKIRWVVEQSIACLNRCRRLSKDYERTTESSESWVKVAAIQRMLRRARPNKASSQPAFKYPKPTTKCA